MPQERPIFPWILLLGLVTFVVYLGVGLYYVTGPLTPFQGLKLDSTGDAFLAVFPGWNGAHEFDDAAYNRAAMAILHDGVPRDQTGALFLHAPVYAYFVALCYWIGGIRLLSIAIPHAIFAGLTCSVVALATFRIVTISKRTAMLIAGVLVLINLRLAMYVGYVSPTILLEFFFSLAVLAASREFTAASLCLFVGAIILAINTQAVFFVAALGAAVWLCYRFYQIKARNLLVAAAVIFFFSIGKVLLPVFLAQDSGGSLNEAAEGVLWEANNPLYDRMSLFDLWESRPNNPWSHWKMSLEEKQRYNDYLERGDHRRTRAALLWIRENPVQYLKLVFIRLWTTLGPFTGMMSPRNRMISLAIWLLIFPAGFYGWWLSRKLPVSHFSIAVIATLTIFGALVIVEWYLRYRFPVELLMTVYAGIGYSHYLTEKLKLFHPDVSRI